MKLSHYLFTAVIAAGLVTLASCKKDRTTVIVNNTSGGSKGSKLNPLNTFASAKPTSQSFTFDNTLGALITGAKGSKFYFAPSSLVHQNGSAVTGNVTVELREYMNKADMLFSGITVTSGNALLESGGMFYIMPRQNGEELKLKSGSTFQIFIPKANAGNEAMDFWNGEPNLDDSFNKIDWVKQDSVPIEQVKDTVQGGGQRTKYFAQFNYFKFGYCNIDREMNKFKTIISKFRIKLPGHCKDTNSTALLLFKNYNSCAWCYWDNSEGVLKTGYSLPLNETAKILVYKQTGPGDDDLAYAVLEITFTDDTLVDFSNTALTPCTNQQLEDIIKAL